MSDMAVKPCFLFSLTFWNSGATLRLGGAKLLIDRFMPPEPECRVLWLTFYNFMEQSKVLSVGDVTHCMEHQFLLL